MNSAYSQKRFSHATDAGLEQPATGQLGPVDCGFCRRSS